MQHRFRAPLVLPADPACSLIRDGVVDVDDTGRITHCGPAATAPETSAPVTTLTGILLPGLVNTHAHSPMTLLRGMGGDLPLLPWLHEIIWPAEAKLRPDDVRIGMLLGSVEMLRHGVTTSAEMYFEAEQLVDAVLTTGGRVLFAAHGVGMAHCPGSNAKLASGIARVAELRAAGVAVGLGTDGPASNDDIDLWEELQLAAMFARLATGDSTVLTAADAFLLATRGGASALGRSDIGALEAGRWADLVHVDLDDPAFACGLDVPDVQLLSNLVWAAGSRRVRDVWVAGERVVAVGESSRVGRAKIQREVAEVSARLRA